MGWEIQGSRLPLFQVVVPQSYQERTVHTQTIAKDNGYDLNELVSIFS